MKNPTSLRTLFSLPGFVAASRLIGLYGDRYARVLVLRRRKNCVLLTVWVPCRGRYDQRICRARDLSAGGFRLYVQFERWRVSCPRCRRVFVERLDWLATNPRFTQRFAVHVGALCREMTNKAVAEAERIHDSTVKALDTIYMQQQVARAGLPAPRAIGVDEIAIRKGHNYRIVVSDLTAGGQSGSAGRAAPKRISISSLPRWARRRRRASNWLRWTCGSPFAIRSHEMRHRHASSSTSSTSCVTSVTRSTRTVAGSTVASPPRTAPSSRASATPCSPTARTSLTTAGRASRSCSRPTHGSTPPTCSRSPSASCGATRPRAGPAPSSSAGNRALNGSGLRPTRSSRR